MQSIDPFAGDAKSGQFSTEQKECYKVNLSTIQDIDSEHSKPGERIICFVHFKEALWSKYNSSSYVANVESVERFL